MISWASKKQGSEEVIPKFQKLGLCLGYSSLLLSRISLLFILSLRKSCNCWDYFPYLGWQKNGVRSIFLCIALPYFSASGPIPLTLVSGNSDPKASGFLPYKILLLDYILHFTNSKTTFPLRPILVVIIPSFLLLLKKKFILLVPSTDGPLLMHFLIRSLYLYVLCIIILREL